MQQIDMDNGIQVGADTPFGLEAFEWLMKNSSVNSYLDKDSLNRIGQALNDKDEKYLKTMYPLILNEFVKEKSIADDFTTKETELLDGFETEVSNIAIKIKKERKEETEKIENEEKAAAENILNNL